ncbi:MAG: hypothetical protein IIY96_05315 [Lachnospiraceae bacterium]|nr:hypothetical protein [Lachnospiraceae bacterium]
MISKEKIRLMTDLAIYEKKNERDVFKINNYYKADYIMWHMLLSLVRYTFVFLVLFGMYVIFRADTLFYNINLDGIGQTLRHLGYIYALGLAVYLVITWLVCAARYRNARKGILLYATKLKRLARRFNY